MTSRFLKVGEASLNFLSLGRDPADVEARLDFDSAEVGRFIDLLVEQTRQQARRSAVHEAFLLGAVAGRQAALMDVFDVADVPDPGGAE